MRDYSKVSPKFWIGDTGKKLKKSGAEAVVVGLYLMTSPHSNMLGLYYQPELLIAHETGLGFEGTSKGLRKCIECGFCRYDAASEMVWVVEMASYQIAESLSASDKRSIGVQNDYNSLPENPFLPAFFDKYQKAFNLTKKREMKPESASLSEAPSEPHRSQEQEQEQEQEHEQAQEQSAEARKNPPKEIAKLELPDWIPEDAWRAFVAMRKKIKAPLTDEAVKLAVDKLAELMQAGHRPRAVLEQSTLNSWRGLFEIKTGQRSSNDPDSRQAFNERENAKAKQLLFGPEVDRAA